MLILEDPSEEQGLSREIARMERRGIVVRTVEHGPITRESFPYGWGRADAEKVTMKWVLHFGGDFLGDAMTVRQTVYSYPRSSDPRDDDHTRRRFGIEFMPEGRDFATRLRLAMREGIQEA